MESALLNDRCASSTLASPAYEIGDSDGGHVLAESDSEPIVRVVDQRPSRFAIRLAADQGRRSEASFLVSKMYGWRGYLAGPLPEDPNSLTLVASDSDQPVATITIGFDSPSGLSVEALYPEEIAVLRESGARVCEFTRFAVDRCSDSLELLAMMFHVAYMYARRLHGATHLLAEVNPRHVGFYRRMLGFQIHGPKKQCPRVEAPAVLLMISLDFGEQQIARYGGRRELAKTMRSLYPLFFSPEEEDGIAARLLGRLA